MRIEKYILRNIKQFLGIELELEDFERQSIVNGYHEAQEDILYHFPRLSETDVSNKLTIGTSYYPVLLYRIGHQLHKQDPENLFGSSLFSLMKVSSACEIYFSNIIGKGLLLPHSTGVVIGSRNVIGEGFIIYQNATIGHLINHEPGATIGANVTIFPNSLVLGEIVLEDNVIIGAHSLLLTSADKNGIYVGTPARKISDDSINLIRKTRPKY